VFALGGGGAYEYTRGTFGAQALDGSGVTMHTAIFKRFGVVTTVRMGALLTQGSLAFEILAEASGMNLFPGTYQDGITSPGPSDREMGYAGSLLFGLRLQ
jgi:hypothetical protein